MGTSAKEIASLNPPLIKVGSPSNQHWEMQKVLRDEYSGMVHISTGMTTKDEVEKIVSFWEQGKGNAKERVILYNCTSGYPVPFQDVCMLELKLLRERFAGRVRGFGFSGHHHVLPNYEKCTKCLRACQPGVSFKSMSTVAL